MPEPTPSSAATDVPVPPEPNYCIEDEPVQPTTALLARCRRAEADAARWRQIAERYAADNDRLRSDLLRHEGHAIRAGGYRHGEEETP